MLKNSNLLRKKDSLVLLVDFQEKLARVMPAREKTEDKILRLLKITGILKIPLIVTEQFPSGLGKTTSPLTEILKQDDRYHPFEKSYFSCFAEPGFSELLQRYENRRQLVLVGIETHICVLQTAMEALEQNYDVFVVADAVCSRSENDSQLALNRMGARGCAVVSYEMVAFEWLRLAGSPDFKAVHKLIV